MERTEPGKKVYILSGLGVDERVFAQIDFHDFQPVFIQWISPDPTDSMTSYASKLLAQIPDKNPVLIGLSFGGMIAAEIANQIEVSKIILIASAKTRSEIPPLYRIAGKLRIHKLVPAALLKTSNFLTNRMFGVKSKQDKVLLKTILDETDPRFLKWAIHQIVSWENQNIHPHLLHIHGASDRILPIRYVSADKVIPNGGHFMTVNKAAEISIVLQELLRDHSINSKN